MTDIIKLWGLRMSANTVNIVVRHTCGHVERYPFEGVADTAGYHMPTSEAARLARLKESPCIEC